MAKKNENPVTEQIAQAALDAAFQNMHRGGMSSSARMCVHDASDLFLRGDYTSAYKRAVDSLKYSVGTFDKQLQAVEALR